MDVLEDTLEPSDHDTYVGKTQGWASASRDIREVAGWWPEAQHKVHYLLYDLEGANPVVKGLRRRVAALPAGKCIRVRYRFCRATADEGCLWLETVVKQAAGANLNLHDGEGGTLTTSGLGGYGWVFILEFLDWDKDGQERG